MREFVETAFREVDVTIAWSGEGVDQVGTCTKTNRVLVRIDPRYFRPTEVDILIGDPAKAKAKLGWSATVGFQELVSEMVRADLDATKREGRPGS